VEGRGLLEPVAAPSVDGPSDEHLVAAVRRGDERAFEALYRRYHRRIGAYVYGMVKDHGRAEDVTQEIFVSALRRMRQTERPIAFKPWIYEIAKNACIDAFRRTRRAEEVSYDAEEGLAPNDYGRLVGSGPTPVEAVAAKEDIDHLRGAFGGLSDMHHEILVMRELEGLSYREIGDRLGLSRPAVESTLFRARKRLTEEYDELVSGARCLRIQAIIASAGAGAVGVRDSRRLARHVAHCQPCRRLAAGAGLDIAALAPPTRRQRVAAKVAGWLPFPIPFLARRGGGGGAQAMAQLAASGGEPAAAGWAKMAIVAATMVFAAVGAGVGEHAVRKHHDATTGSAASQGAASRLVRHDTPLGSAAAATSARGTQATRTAASHDRTTATRDRGRRTTEGNGGGADAPTGGGGGNAPGGASGGGGASSTSPGAGSSGGGGPSLPKNPVTDLAGGAGGGAGLPVDVPQNPVQTVTDTANQAAGAAGQTVQGATGSAGDTVDQTTGTVGDTVDQVTDTAGNAVNQVTGGGAPHLP
jgi:RNA polymerase sigma factor (sigma-70 family)